MAYKYYEERAKELGLTLFIEKVGFIVKPEQIEEYKEAKLEESASGKSEFIIGVVRGAPISKFTENLNGRIYTRALWERVAKLKMAEGSFCLAGHPPDDEEDDPRRMFGVWKNMRVLESVVVADLHVIRCEEGVKFWASIKTGGKNGLSSVGYGELMTDDKTVNPETYMLERKADWVLQPSQQVYATFEHVQESYINELKPLTEVHTNDHKSEITEKKVNVIMSTDNIMAKIGEANLKNLVKSHIKEANIAIKAKDIVKMQEKIKDVKEQLTIVPFEEEKLKLEAILGKLEEAAEAEASSMKDENLDYKSKLADTEKKKTDADAMCESLQKKLRKATEIIEKLGGTAEDPEKLKIVEAMQDDIEKFVEDRKNMDADIKVLVKEREDMLADIKIFKEDRDNMKADLDVLMKERTDMLADISIFKEERSVMKSDIDSLVEDSNSRDADLKNLIEDRVTMLEDINQLVIDRKTMKGDIKQLKTENSKFKEAAELENLGAFPFQEQPVAEKISVPLSGEAESIIADPAVKRHAVNTQTPDQLEGLDKPRSNKMQESKTESVVIKKAILGFYESKVKEFPGLSRVKDSILSANSVNEAVEIYDALTKMKDPVIKINESSNGVKKRPGWLVGYK